MEFSLHRQLKQRYAAADSQQEVPVDGYRIDVVIGSRLVEIQHASLSSIRDKIHRLLAGQHRVLVVKPIVVRKQLVKCERKGGEVCSRRMSPKTGRLVDLFDELVYFTRVFPHPRLALDIPLVDVEEWRYPGQGRRRRRRDNAFQVQDQKLTQVHETVSLRKAADLLRLIPDNLPRPFHTGHLAERMEIDRGFAQRVAYCLRETGAVKQAGKQGNTRLYVLPVSKRRRAG